MYLKSPSVYANTIPVHDVLFLKISLWVVTHFCKITMTKEKCKIKDKTELQMTPM